SPTSGAKKVRTVSNWLSDKTISGEVPQYLLADMWSMHDGLATKQLVGKSHWSFRSASLPARRGLATKQLVGKSYIDQLIVKLDDPDRLSDKTIRGEVPTYSIPLSLLCGSRLSDKTISGEVPPGMASGEGLGC